MSAYHSSRTSADAVLTTSTDGLALPTDTVPLPGLSDAPAKSWYVGIDFDTLKATICEHALIVQDCDKRIQMELQPVSTASFVEKKDTDWA